MLCSFILYHINPLLRVECRRRQKPRAQRWVVVKRSWSTQRARADMLHEEQRGTPVMRHAALPPSPVIRQLQLRARKCVPQEMGPL